MRPYLSAELFKLSYLEVSGAFNQSYQASEDGHESCVRAMLEAGADKDAKNNDGMTALMDASQNGHEIVATLLSVSK